MTGFGAGEARVEHEGREVRVRVDIRAVNHRFLDVRSRVAQAVSDHAPAVEELVGKRLRRGHVEIGVRVEGRLDPVPALDADVARAAYRQLQSLRDELTPGEPVPLTLLSTVPGLFSSTPGDTGLELRGPLLEAATQACDAVDAMRIREGTALAEELGMRLESVRAKLAQIRLRCPALVEAQRARLRERLARMMSENELKLDETRLEHEVALFAERTDVAEEVARLDAHCDQFDELMHGTGPSHGRKLDFLLQEMAREVNTLGAKTPEVEITRVVVELKADVERMREQVQNVL
ncbi:MAG: YicC family protein [Sandaracinus sp.]|nr:YicC family protein [Sandaracinus sp.]MCB9632308.1 YicC family protein [Sandaracinus sp.]